jgi:4-hydroxybenzoate polyprenyltransferase
VEPASHEPRSAATARALPWPLLRSLRPEQWPKNLLVLVAPFFGRQLLVPGHLLAACLGVVAFCALASAVYLVNDVVDRDRDRVHPTKRHRPIAAGALAPGTALAVAALLALAGLGLSAAIGTSFVVLAAAYVALQVLYMTVLKNVVIVDLFAIAAGFVLRVVAGADAAGVPVSNWLYLCTILGSLFLVLEKRRAEIVALGPAAARHRPILAEYPAGWIDQMVTVLATCTILGYGLYTVAPDTLARFGTDRLKLTVPFVLFGLARYLYLVHRHGAGGAPERVLLDDRPTQVNLGLWLATAAWAIYG